MIPLFGSIVRFIDAMEYAPDGLRDAQTNGFIAPLFTTGSAQSRAMIAGALSVSVCPLT